MRLILDTQEQLERAETRLYRENSKEFPDSDVVEDYLEDIRVLTQELMDVEWRASIYKTDYSQDTRPLI